jgi:hypothetical protein
MASEGLGEMIEGDSADMCAGKVPLVSIGGRAEGLARADPGARTPIGASGIYIKLNLSFSFKELLNKILLTLPSSYQKRCRFEQKLLFFITIFCIKVYPKKS